MIRNKKVYNPYAICHSRISKERFPARYENCVLNLKRRQGMVMPESVDIRDWIYNLAESSNMLENRQAETLAMRNGISVSKSKDGRYAVLSHPKLGRRMVKVRRGDIRTTDMRSFIKDKGKVTEQAEESPLRLRTAKGIAATKEEMVEVTQDSLMTAAWVRNLTLPIWKGDVGTIIRDDGNRYTISLPATGYVLVPKDDFDGKFKFRPDQEVGYQLGQA